jgi:hypothetical protein
MVRRGWREAIYSQNEAVRGKIFVLTGAPARSWWPARIPAAGDGMARAEQRDGSGGDGMARAEVVGGISPVGRRRLGREGGRGGRSQVR